MLLFDERNKLIADGPFLDLLGKWKRRLWGDDNLRVAGYSFGDDHVTIARWLETDKSRTLAIRDVEEGKSFSLGLSRANLRNAGTMFSIDDVREMTQLVECIRKDSPKPLHPN